MPAAADMLSEGFLALLETSGETLTVLRSTTVNVSAVVDRNVAHTKRKHEVSFDAERASMVAIVAGAVTPALRTGESLRDSHNRTHRIAQVLPLDGLVERYRCEVS